MQFAYLVETVKKKINGKDKSYTLRTPLSAWEIMQNDDGGSGGSSSGSETGGGNDYPPVINP